MSRLLLALFFSCLLPAHAETLAALDSPDHRLRLELHQEAHDHTLYLYRHGQLIWHWPAGVWDRLVAAWSSDSSELLFVSAEDRFTLNYLPMKTLFCSPIDETPLLKWGEKVVPYNWNATGQGSIPHDNIFNLDPGAQPRSFRLIYYRSGAPGSRYTTTFDVSLDANLKPTYQLLGGAPERWYAIQPPHFATLLIPSKISAGNQSPASLRHIRPTRQIVDYFPSKSRL
jgi:hypothetical protein